jgi:hypothetical protein
MVIRAKMTDPSQIESYFRHFDITDTHIGLVCQASKWQINVDLPTANLDEVRVRQSHIRRGRHVLRRIRLRSLRRGGIKGTGDRFKSVRKFPFVICPF